MLQHTTLFKTAAAIHAVPVGAQLCMWYILQRVGLTEINSIC